MADDKTTASKVAGKINEFLDATGMNEFLDAVENDATKSVGDFSNFAGKTTAFIKQRFSYGYDEEEKKLKMESGVKDLGTIKAYETAPPILGNPTVPNLGGIVREYGGGEYIAPKRDLGGGQSAEGSLTGKFSDKAIESKPDITPGPNEYAPNDDGSRAEKVKPTLGTATLKL